MSHAIDCSTIRSVLLADGWHRVSEHSFTLKRYEYVQGAEIRHTAGADGVCSTAFQFADEAGYVLSGPLTSILASQAH